MSKVQDDIHSVHGDSEKVLDTLSVLQLRHATPLPYQLDTRQEGPVQKMRPIDNFQNQGEIRQDKESGSIRAYQGNKRKYPI